MTAVRRRSARSVVSAATTLATADDLDGTTDNSQVLDVSGAGAVLIVQIDNGAGNGTAGIDVIEVSYDDGATWAACDSVLALASDSFTGTILAGGALNAAGIEPAAKAAVFKAGPFHGKAMIRCGRKTTTTTGTTWVGNAPSVIAFKVN